MRTRYLVLTTSLLLGGIQAFTPTQLSPKTRRYTSTSSPLVNSIRSSITPSRQILNLAFSDDEDDEPVAKKSTEVLAGSSPPCVIKILGVGGGGGNAVNRMIGFGVEGVTFWALNTDAQALAKSLAPNVLNIGRQLTKGLGAGGEPEVGEKAALENTDELERICEGADMVFITAGMGGGTGSGAATVLADIAKNRCGCLTVGVVTKPFAFEGNRRKKQAERSIEKLREKVDTLIVISNDKLLQIVPENTPVTDAFLVADDILRQGVVGISEIILKTGLVNVDFADVRAVMKNAGSALMGVGTGTGKTRAADAAISAISSPLLDFPIKRAKRIVFNIVGPADMGLKEINEASEVIYENADEDANIIFGALIDPAIESEISITVLACDFDIDAERQILTYGVEEEKKVEAPASQKAAMEMKILSDVNEPPRQQIAEDSDIPDESSDEADSEQEEEAPPKKKGGIRRVVGKIFGRNKDE